PIIIDYIPEIFEEIETILPISETDIKVGNEQLEQPAAREIAESADYSQSAPQKVQSNVAHGIYSNYTNTPDLTISTHLKPKVHCESLGPHRTTLIGSLTLPTAITTKTAQNS